MNHAAAFDLFNSVLNDASDSSAETCLISGLPIDGSRVTFPCSHSFNYVPLLNDLISYRKLHGHSSLRCPYCRTTTSGVIPYRPDVAKTSRRGVNLPVSDCFMKHECSVDGCSNNATVPVPDGFACSTHYKRLLKPALKPRRRAPKVPDNVVVTACSAILKSGSRKGTECGAKTSTGFCKRHSQPS
jgi:hypothetical protein